MQKPTLAILLIACNCIVHAQQTGRMETDRPDQTESPFIVKHNYIQVETGFNYESENGWPTFIFPTVLWKYGATKKLELRLITEIVSIETPLMIPDGNEVLSGLLPVQIGGKFSLWEEKGLLPKTSFLFHVAPPKWGSKKFHTEKWAPNFRFAMQHTLSEHTGLGYNLGAEWDGFSNTPYWIYTLSPGFNIGKRWYAYIEPYGAFRKNEKPRHGIDYGFACFIKDNFKIDISSGKGIAGAVPDWYIAIGFSLRFRVRSKE